MKDGIGVFGHHYRLTAPLHHEQHQNIQAYPATVVGNNLSVSNGVQ